MNGTKISEGIAKRVGFARAVGDEFLLRIPEIFSVSYKSLSDLLGNLTQDKWGSEVGHQKDLTVKGIEKIYEAIIDLHLPIMYIRFIQLNSQSTFEVQD